MIEVFPSLFVGDQGDYDGLTNKGEWAIVHACKEPYHRRALGYKGLGAPKDDPEYLFALRGNELALNLVDALDVAYIPTAVIERGKAFIEENIGERKVLVHCNKGESRGPSLALLYLHESAGAYPGTYEDAKKAFKKTYPPFAPSSGIEGFIKARWIV